MLFLGGFHKTWGILRMLEDLHASVIRGYVLRQQKQEKVQKYVT